MAFDEAAIFPTNIAKGSKGSLALAADTVQLDSGVDERVARWPNALRAYNARFGIRKYPDLRTVHDFVLARDGVVRGFRFKDHFDFTTKAAEPDKHIGAHTKDDQSLGQGDGTTTAFQLKKVYTDGVRSVTRLIRKPVSGTILVALDGSLQADPADYTVDNSTGIVTFGTAPTGGGTPQEVTAGCEFHVPVQFSGDPMDLLTVSLDAYKAGNIANIFLKEMGGDVVTPDLPWRGGSSEQAVTSPTKMFDWVMGHCVRWDPDASGRSVILPDITNLPLGGPILTFENADASFSLAFLNRSSGATEFTMAASTSAILYVHEVGGVKSWLALKGV